MSFIKTITGINWVFISVYGALVLYMLTQLGSGLGHEMPGVGTFLKGVAVLLLLTFTGLNWLPYQWAKITALILILLFSLLVYVFFTD